MGHAPARSRPVNLSRVLERPRDNCVALDLEFICDSVVPPSQERAGSRAALFSKSDVELTGEER